MAAPSYTTDLTDITLAENTGTWGEWGGMTGGGLVQKDDVDYNIQGSYHSVQSTGSSGLASIYFDYGSGIGSIPTDGAVLIWNNFLGARLLDTLSNGGVRMVIGSGTSDWKAWKLGGKDVRPNPVGGWRNYAIDPSLTADYSNGSPTTTLRYFGTAVNLTSGAARGYPHAVDAIRYGRCELRINGGESANYATFSGAAAQDSNSGSYRWGLLLDMPGGYLWKGLLTLGYSSAIDFRDSNTMVMIDDCRKVGANFTKIEIRQSGSRVDWTNITFVTLVPASNIAKGRLEVVDDCDVNITGCTFTGMDTFIFKASSSVLSSIFRGCGQITANGAEFDGSVFSGYEGTADTSYLIWDVATDPNGKLDGCSFTMGTAATHAIEFGTSSPTTMTLTDVTFSGYGADGTTSAAIHIKRTTGTVTINITGGTTPTYKTDGATVTIVSGSRTVKAIVTTATGTKIQTANVFLYADTGGPFPSGASVTIVNSGSTATVTHASHGLSTNDYVWIQGASLDANNGVFAITKIDSGSYSYTMGSSPGSSPTGSITSTFVFLKGTTDSLGEISMSRVIPSTQPAKGWARKSSGSPYYRTGSMSGSVSSSENTTFSAVLISDD